jgi:very-short-patch-repair endonuclease
MNEKDIVKMYVEDKASPYVIAKKYNTYPNKIRRLLQKLGIPLNDKSIAQKNAIQSGRTKHPTKGKKRPEKVKEKISETVSISWKNISEKERQKRVDKARQQWYNMTEEERNNLRNLAAEAVRRAAKDGSKLENFIAEKLNENGFDVIFHKKGLIPNDNLEVDIFIPSINTAIEIDGPTHFLPIWGEENLQKHINADSKKSGLLINYGFCIIRIRNTIKSISEKNKRDIFNKIFETLTKIKRKFPPKNKRYIELEVS